MSDDFALHSSPSFSLLCFLSCSLLSCLLPPRCCCPLATTTTTTTNRYKKAVKHFSEAISWDTTNHVYFSNRSAAQIYCGKFKSALRDALKCVQLKPKWAKGYSRLGTAQFYLQNYKAAIAALKQGLVLEPSNDGMKSMLVKSEGLYEEQLTREAARKVRKQEKGAGLVVLVGCAGGVSWWWVDFPTCTKTTAHRQAGIPQPRTKYKKDSHVVAVVSQ